MFCICLLSMHDYVLLKLLLFTWYCILITTKKKDEQLIENQRLYRLFRQGNLFTLLERILISNVKKKSECKERFPFKLAVGRDMKYIKDA